MEFLLGWTNRGFLISWTGLHVGVAGLLCVVPGSWVQDRDRASLPGQRGCDTRGVGSEHQRKVGAKRSGAGRT